MMRLTLALSLALAGCTSLPRPPSTAAGMWLTTADETQKLAPQADQQPAGTAAGDEMITIDTSKRFQAFRSAYAKRFGKEPVFGSVLAHDAATVALDALSRRPAGMSVKEALIKLGPYEALQQQIRFDENGDTTRVAYFMAIRDGHFVRDQ